MRLSVDVLQSAPQVVNPLQQRELDLRGLGITLLDDGPLTLLGDSFDVINLSSNPISSLQYFPFQAVSVAATPNGTATVSAAPARSTQESAQRHEVDGNQYNPARARRKGKWFDDISDEDNESKVPNGGAAGELFVSPAGSLAATAVALATGATPSIGSSNPQSAGVAIGSQVHLVTTRGPLMQRLKTLICHRCNLSFVSPSTCVRALPNITAFLADDNAFDHPRQLLFLRGWKQLEIVSFENNRVIANTYPLLQSAREGETDAKNATGAAETSDEAHQPDEEETVDESADSVKGKKGGSESSAKRDATAELSASEKAARAMRYFRMLIIYLCPTLKLINYERVSMVELQGASKLRKRFAKDIRLWETGSSAAASTSAVAPADGVRVRKRGRHAVAVDSSSSTGAAGEKPHAIESSDVGAKKKRLAKESGEGQGKSASDSTADKSGEPSKRKAKNADSGREEKDIAARMAELIERTNAAETEEELLALQVEIDALQEAANAEGKSK